jgi:hypothetical protein
MSIEEELRRLGEARKSARAERNFALADELRDQILALGFEIIDTPEGFSFAPSQKSQRKKFPSYQRIGDIRSLLGKSYQVSIALIVDGFAEDARETVRKIKEFTSEDVGIVLLINGEQESSPLEPLLDVRTQAIAIVEKSGWGIAANTLLKVITSKIVVIMDPSTRFTGDAITPIMDKFESYEAVGWKGGLINLADNWRSVDDRGPGEVDVLFSYFLALNREAALEAGGFNARAIYYRNADIEFSLRLRQAHGRLLQMDLPLEQARHHGYYDVDPVFREEESQRTYNRILERFRGKDEILVPRR